MYRLLKAAGLLGHRGDRKKPQYGTMIKTEATKPNQVWCWDISYLRTRITKEYFYLYTYIDIFSRKIVGHAVYDREDGKAAASLFKQSLNNESVTGENMRLHNDSGTSMRSTAFVDQVQALGVTMSRSRPRVSDDNPFIEAFFRTLKYSPQYPTTPFTSVESAQRWADSFIDRYNNQDLHSGINYVTPSARHQGMHLAQLEKRKAVFDKARLTNPNRWSRHAHQWQPDTVVTLKPESCRVMKKTTTL